MFQKIIQLLDRILLPMYKFYEENEEGTTKPFSRFATFRQFIINVMGCLLRKDTYGVTSFVRSLGLSGDCYQNLLHMFRSDGIDLKTLRHAWVHSVKENAPLYYSDNELKKKSEDRFVTLVIDHKKNSKEARKMPLVHKMFQESETQSKAEYIFGHCWGAVGLLIGSASRLACLPLMTDIEDGLKGLATWSESNIDKHDTMIIRLYKNVIDCAGQLSCNCRFIADRAFLSVPGMKLIDQYNESAAHVLHIITKCKRGVTGYTDPPPKKTGMRGRPRRKGEPVKLIDLFKTKIKDFTEEELMIYGEKKMMKYYVIDLLWGLGYYRKMRFVLSLMNGSIWSILVTSDLSLSGKEVIEEYCKRYRIETMFRTLSQNGAFGYRFWTKALDKLNRFTKAGDPDPLSLIRDKDRRRKILNCIQAIEMYMLVCNVAIGINQIISVSVNIDPLKLRWQRTPAKLRPSEENIQDYLIQLFFSCMRAGVFDQRTEILQIIHTAQQHQSRAKCTAS